MLLGAALPWMFSAWRSTRSIVRRVSDGQRSAPSIPYSWACLEGKVPPDYRQCVTISTTAAQNELLSLAVLAIIPPILVGLLFGSWRRWAASWLA
jgi:K(+)-stimulated pyrophosphate-energized sodium pump